MIPDTTHICRTGPYAGERFCGTNNQDGGTNYHLPYIADVVGWAQKHITCRDCLAVLLASETEVEEN